MGNILHRAKRHTDTSGDARNKNDDLGTRVEIGALYENMPVLFALTGWVFILLLFVTTTTTCLGHSIGRVFGTTRDAKSLIVIADGGDQTFATGNTIDAYRAAMQYTKWLRISVYPVFHNNNDNSSSTETEYYLLSDDTVHYRADGTLNPFRCATLVDNSSLDTVRTSLAMALDLAVAYNATVVLHHVPCVPYISGEIGTATAGSEPAAIVALHSHVINLVPASYLVNIVYTYSDSATVDVLYRLYRLTRHAFMYEGGSNSTFATPFASSRGHEPSLSINTVSYDLWTCSQHIQVHQGTWLNLYNVDTYLKKAIVYSAARSIQTIDPRTVTEYITSYGFHVVSSR